MGTVRIICRPLAKCSGVQACSPPGVRSPNAPPLDYAHRMHVMTVTPQPQKCLGTAIEIRMTRAIRLWDFKGSTDDSRGWLLVGMSNIRGRLARVVWVCLQNSSSALISVELPIDGKGAGTEP